MTATNDDLTQVLPAQNLTQVVPAQKRRLAELSPFGGLQAAEDKPAIRRH